MADESTSVMSEIDAGPIKTKPTASSDTSSGPTQILRVSENKNDDVHSLNYPFDDKKLNIAIIFNHLKYNTTKGTPNERTGTEEDAKNITETLTDLNFTVKRYDDLKFGALHDIVKKLAKQDRATINCIIIIVMTHGEKDNILWANDKSYSVDNLIDPFKDPNTKLAGVPKLFFIQACRGGKVDKGSQIDGAVAKNTIPSTADILIMYSTFKGYVAWRDVTGSWFIKTLATQLLQNTEWDLLQILTRVNYIVAYEYVSNNRDDSLNKGKQVSEFTSSLTKFFKFERSKTDSINKRKRIEIFLRMFPG